MDQSTSTGLRIVMDWDRHLNGATQTAAGDYVAHQRLVQWYSSKMKFNC